MLAEGDWARCWWIDDSVLIGLEPWDSFLGSSRSLGSNIATIYGHLLLDYIVQMHFYLSSAQCYWFCHGYFCDVYNN